MTTFNKALVSAVTHGTVAYAAFTSACSGIFDVFGTGNTAAQIFASLIIAAVGGGITWWVPNKSVSTISK